MGDFDSSRSIAAAVFALLAALSLGVFLNLSDDAPTGSSLKVKSLRANLHHDDKVVLPDEGEDESFTLSSPSSFEAIAFDSRRELEPLAFDLELIVPATAEEITLVDLSSITPTDGIVKLLAAPASPEELLVLHRKTSKQEYIPVSRSYNGYDWEAAPGLHAHLPITCAIDADHKCLLQIPVSEDDIYFVTKYTRTVLDEVKVSRFLEKATFGPRLSEINKFDTIDLEQKMANYVQDLIAQPVDSHREFWRSRLNNRKLETYKHGISGPKPCDQNSRWRIFAFTQKDQKASYGKKALKMKIETKTVNNVLGYVISFGGFPRTVLYEPMRYEDATDNTVDVPDGEYWLFYVEGKQKFNKYIQSIPPLFVYS